MARSRRVQGSGSIFYRASKQRWVAQISISDPATGKRRNITRLARTAKEAQALLEELRQHHHTPTGTQTVHEWIDWYVRVHTAEQLQSDAIRPSTAQAISVRTNRLKQVIPKTLRIDELDAHNLDQIRQRYDQTGYARATQNRDLTQLSTIMDLAVYHGLATANKVKVMRKLPTPKTAKPILSIDQIHTLLNDVRDEWLEPWYVLAIPSGARCMEVCGITWDNINLENKTLTIAHQLLNRHGETRLAPLKMRGEDETRRVPLSDWQIERLHHIRRTQDWAAHTRQDWIGNTLNLVVTTPRGQGAYNAQIAADLKRRVDRLGLPPVTPHSFRRTAVSILLSQGVDIATCMKVMGWKNAKVPLEIYAQLTEDGFDQVRNVFKGLAA